jgi:uncharacterized membrane protein YgcG
MAQTLNAVMSDQFANSYVDVAYADAYFSGHVNATKSAAWAALSADQKASALISATWVIEQLKFTVPTVPWDATLQYDNLLHAYYYSSPSIPGSAIKYSALQSLQFPRNVDSNYSGVFIPEAVKDAQCEQAVFMLSADEDSISKTLSGIVSESFSGGGITISTRYGGASASGGGNSSGGSLIAPLTKQFLNPYILRNTGMRFRRS